MRLEMADMVDLALQVTGMSREKWDRLMQTMQVDADMNKVMREEWFERPRDNEGAIRDYYRKSDIWFVNTFCHGVGALLRMNQGAAPAPAVWSDAFKGFLKGDRVLDYGGGFFNDTWSLVREGFHVVQAEVKGPVTEFLKAFLARTDIHPKIEGQPSPAPTPASVLEVDWSQPLKEQYDGVVTFETLEHLLEPVALTRHIVEHMKPGAPMVMSASFGAPEHAPYHVASNATLAHYENWPNALKSMGLDQVWIAEDRHKQIWRKR